MIALFVQHSPVFFHFLSLFSFLFSVSYILLSFPSPLSFLSAPTKKCKASSFLSTLDLIRYLSMTHTQTHAVEVSRANYQIELLHLPHRRVCRFSKHTYKHGHTMTAGGAAAGCLPSDACFWSCWAPAGVQKHDYCSGFCWCTVSAPHVLFCHSRTPIQERRF